MTNQPTQQQPVQQQPQHSTPSATDVLFATGVPSAEFEVGVEVGGYVAAEPLPFHEHEYNPSAPGQGPLKYWPNGEPVWGLRVDVMTGQRDPFNPADNGRRRIYLSGKRQLAAVREAVQAAGASAILPGGQLYLTKGPKITTENNVEANTWAARYLPPVPVGQQQAFTQQQTPTQQQGQQPQQQQQFQPQQQYQQPASNPGPDFYSGGGGYAEFTPQQNQQIAQQQPQPVTAQPVQQQQPQQPQQQQYTPEQIIAARNAGIVLPGM